MCYTVAYHEYIHCVEIVSKIYASKVSVQCNESVVMYSLMKAF